MKVMSVFCANALKRFLFLLSFGGMLCTILYSCKRPDNNALITLHIKNSPRQSLQISFINAQDYKLDTILLLGNKSDEVFNLVIPVRNGTEQALKLFFTKYGPNYLTPILLSKEHMVMSTDLSDIKQIYNRTRFYGSARTAELYAIDERSVNMAKQRIGQHDKYLNSVMLRTGDTALQRYRVDSLDFIRANFVKEYALKTRSPYIVCLALASSQVEGFNFSKEEFAILKKRYKDKDLQFLLNNYEQTQANSTVKNNILINKTDGVNINTFLKNFTLPDANGRIKSLSQFKGKYVLVDVWASWCGPCRGEAPYLKEALSRFGKDNFVIVSISIDESHQKWKTAIKEDHTGNFIHLIDDRGWKSDVVKQCQITAVPTNYLLNPAGKVIDKNLRGKEMVVKLNQLFNHNKLAKL